MSNEVELNKAKELVCRYINEMRIYLTQQYCTYDGKRWDCDDNSKSNIMGANIIGMLAGGTLPEGFVWRDYDNNNHEVTLEYMVNLAKTIGVFYVEVYTASWQHKAAVNALTTVEDVENYDYHNTLWPDPDL